jgi:ABC-2 type transport system ATP-binding protein
VESASAIEVSGLRKAYRGTLVLDQLDLTVRTGEVFALLGPNAAGKTTTIEICEGHRRADAGQIRVLGADPWRPGRRWRSRLGIVAQHTDDFADVTVAEAVSIVAGLFPSARDVDEVIDAVGLTEDRNHRCLRLSGGRRRRLDVALGIVGRPELLFLDEPTTGFDPQARQQFWQLIRSLNADGVTVLLTTHYLDEAEHLADRVAVIAAGRVLDIGAPQVIGGREEAAARVRWLERDGTQHEHRTTEPTRFVEQLATRFGGEVPQLVIERPTLEDVYVRMIERANLARAEQRGPVRDRRRG